MHSLTCTGRKGLGGLSTEPSEEPVYEGPLQHLVEPPRRSTDSKPNSNASDAVGNANGRERSALNAGELIPMFRPVTVVGEGQ